MARTVESYIKKFIGKRTVYDYRVFGPSSLEDTCNVTVKITYDYVGQEFFLGKSRQIEFYKIDFSNPKKPPVVKQVRSL